MSSLIRRIKDFARTPQGRRAIDQARRAASDPRRRAQARTFLSRFRTRR
ncbi:MULTISPECIES: hypothetical protein [Streptomyces]|nr:hypothetical protein [Streptomyces sp. CAI-85]MBO7939864.1 hypothetical protein [Streptomyces sp. S9]NUV58375.1 hypothetical protein [Streptomyces sp. CAI-85]